MKKLAVLGVVLLALVLTGSALSAYTINTIDRVTSTFAMRPVKTHCEYADEDGSPNSIGAWGYVIRPVGKAQFDHVDGDLCDAVLRINDSSIDPYARAMGVLVIVHEAYHLRHWGAAGSEAKVECQAIRHWKVGARLLGAREDTVAALWPWALAAHYEETNLVPWLQPGEHPYRDDSCVIPPLVP